MPFRDIYIFEHLDTGQLKRLKEISHVKEYKKGDTIFFEGDQPEKLIILTDGILKVYKTDPRGNEIILSYFYPTALIAELANLEHIAYPASAVFETDGKAISIDYKIFEKEFLKNPDISFSIIKSLTKKLRTLDNVISQNLTMDSTSRVAKFIYESEHLFAQLKQNKIAAILNITPETMSRVMKKLKGEGVIDYAGKKLTVMDREGLKDCFE
ncbi:MAG: Crp/Fnr family transcriptional regulator [Proteobacteria bacterium]|nr:Crp/Fnr family transcriptional regulator [Pseudomonadota bacterium]